jgi:hypothetical protein
MSGLTLWAGTRRRLILTTVALLVVALVSVYTRGSHATWRQALDWGTGSTVLVGPVAAGLAAWTYARMRQAAFAEYVSATPKDLAGWTGPAVLVWLQASGALLVATAIATAHTALVGIPSHPGDLPILLQALAALATYVGLGACLGALVGQVWVAPVAAVLGYLLMFLSIWGLLPGTFDTGGASGSLVGNVFNGRVIALQGVVALGMTAALVLGAVSVLAARHRVLSTLIGVAIVAGAGALVHLDGNGHERYAYPAGPVPLTCAGDAPEVCVARDAPRPLQAMAREFATQARVLEELGLDVPDRFQVGDFFVRNPKGVGLISFYDDDEARSDVRPEIVSQALATPGDCAAYSDSTPTGDAIGVHFLFQQWAGDRLGTRRVNRDDEFGTWMRSEETLQWARSIYPKLAACDFTGVKIPGPARQEYHF